MITSPKQKAHSILAFQLFISKSMPAELSEEIHWQLAIATLHVPQILLEQILLELSIIL